ncbi:MAG: fibronectin type III domain-containing protein [Verrucomicrobiales bacterium]|nr:fibronectin type III domain-containing protein [Verrucomicrobiales bacterium]
MDAHKTFAFAEPHSTEGTENLLKLYLALGDPLSQALGPARALYQHVAETIEARYLQSRLASAGAELTLGGYAKADASVGWQGGRQANIGAVAELSGAVGASVGAEARYRVKDESWSGERDLVLNTVGIMGHFEGTMSGAMPVAGDSRGIGLSLDLLSLAAEGAFRAGLMREVSTGRPVRAEFEQEAVLELKLPAGNALGWVRLAPGLDNDVAFVLGEQVMFDLPDAGAFSRLSGEAVVWNLVSGLGQGGVLRRDQPAALAGGLLSAALNDGAVVRYRRSVYGAKRLDLSGEIDLDAVLLGLGVSFEGALERGAEVVMEEGRIWRARRMGLRTGPAFSQDLIPTESILAIEGRWARNAAGPIGQVLGRVVNRIKEAGETVVETGSETGKAVIRFGEGALDQGAEVVSSWFRTGAGGGPRLHGAEAGQDGYLPPVGAANYVYGVSGVFRFESASPLTEPVLLTLSYTDEDVEGLNPASLGICLLETDGKRWRWVGGAVDVVAKTVSAMIERLGTFVLAPPLPTGELRWVPGGDRLPADGEAKMAFAVTNLLLNTGEPVTASWLYTVIVDGATLEAEDARPAEPGVQVVASEGALRFSVRAPVGGQRARLEVVSLVGDARGEYELALLDDTPPAVPGELAVRPGQSRLWLSWKASGESDVTGYRVYYGTGRAGPPWDHGATAVEGTPPPVNVVGTNTVLRGLVLGTNYFVAVAAVDSSGNEGPATVAGPITTTEEAPAAPTQVVLRFESDGVATLAWTASEDDGFNDRDVAGYEVWRAVLPGGTYQRIAGLPARADTYLETPLETGGGQFLRYGVRAVDSGGLTSAMVMSERFLESGVGVDNDGDGMADDWERRWGLDPEDPRDAEGDADGDGVSNLEEYRRETVPTTLVARIQAVEVLGDGRVALTLSGPGGGTWTVQGSADLVEWRGLGVLSGEPGLVRFVDAEAPTLPYRYYRAWWGE